MGGAFALIAFIGGLFCRRLRTALIVGAVPAVLYVALVIIGLCTSCPTRTSLMCSGRCAILVILLFAALGYCLRRGVARIFRRRA